MIHTELSESLLRGSGGFGGVSQLPSCILFVLWASDSSSRPIESPKSQIFTAGCPQKGQKHEDDHGRGYQGDDT